MTIAHDTLNNKYDIIELTKEELSEIGEVLDYCPLPLKRNFYGLKKNIDNIVKQPLCKFVGGGVV